MNKFIIPSMVGDCFIYEKGSQQCVDREMIDADTIFAIIKDCREYDHVYINKKRVKIASDRLQTFLKNDCCVCCGAKGTIFNIERHEKQDVYHLNLYSYNDGAFRLMTKDHIVPKSKGGKNHISNYQTMCVNCNGAKGNKVPPKFEKVVHNFKECCSNCGEMKSKFDTLGHYRSCERASEMTDMEAMGQKCQHWIKDLGGKDGQEM